VSHERSSSRIGRSMADRRLQRKQASMPFYRW
jgi:hypothetical protein